MFWAIVAACTSDDEVLLEGIVWDGPGGTSPSLADAEITVLDELGQPLASTSAGGDGAFEVVVPGGYAVYVEVRRDGYATTTFPGRVGLQSEQRVEDHTIYGVPLEEADTLFATFEDCPGAQEGGAIVYGQVQLDGLSDAVTGGSPTVGTAEASVVHDGVARRVSCYYDWSGQVYEPKWTRSGPSGRFVVFDVQPGIQVIEVDYEVAPGVWMRQAYPVWIPDDPVVLSPWFPFLVAFPL